MAVNNNSIPKFNTLSGFNGTFSSVSLRSSVSVAQTWVACRVARSSVGGLNRARQQHTSSVREGTSGVLLFARSMKTVFAHSTISHPSRPLPLTAFTFLLWGECSSSVSFLLSVHVIYTSSYGFSSIFPSARNLFLTQRRQQQKAKRRRKFAPERTRRKQAKFYFRADGWFGAEEAESFMMIWH